MSDEQRRDAAALYDMLLRARRAHARASGMSLERFLEDEDAQDVVVRCLLVVGEAANRVSATRRAALPDIPWTQISGMRNRLVHDYGNIDIEQVWVTATTDLPALIQALEGAEEPSAL